MTKAPLDSVRSDFDRIATLAAHHADEPDPYDAFLLSLLPARCERVLEVGCGAGRLARAAAAHASSVLALDLSPEMIRVARERAGGNPKIRFVCGDFMAEPLDRASFDCVLSVATLHHLDTTVAVQRMRDLVRPGGVLVLHDLRAPTGATDWLVSGLTALANGDAWRWIRSRLRTTGHLRQAWRAHGASDVYLDMHEIRAFYPLHLPGARLFRHALWRYTAVWTRD